LADYLSLKGQPSQQSDFSINSMMGNTGNTSLVNGRTGLHEQQGGFSQQGQPSGPGYQAQVNTPDQHFSPLKTRRMRTNPATSLSQNSEFHQGSV
jgi:hypothetical protein